MSEVLTYNIGTALVTEECCNCGVIFAMPEAMKAQLLKTGNTFYCPSGHPQVYSENTEKKLRRVEGLLREEYAYSDTLRKQRDGALRQVSAHKGVATRMKKRVHAGVCIECHRHFENLERHMKTKHTK